MATRRQRWQDGQLQARIQQQTIDAEIRMTGRILLNRLRRQLLADPWALSDETFLAVAATTGEPAIVNDITRSPVFAGQPTLDLLRDAASAPCIPTRSATTPATC